MALKETGVPIGICGLLKRESMQHFEIGFAFLKRFWAKGYAFESAAAVMNYGRISLGLRRFAATTPSGNCGTIHVLEKLRLRFARMFHFKGQEGETSLYAFEGYGPLGVARILRPRRLHILTEETRA